MFSNLLEIKHVFLLIGPCPLPHGWLFCSYVLATFSLLYLVQSEMDWAIQTIVEIMSVLIKLLQIALVVASCVFRDHGVPKMGIIKGFKQTRLIDGTVRGDDMMSTLAKKSQVRCGVILRKCN